MLKYTKLVLMYRSRSVNEEIFQEDWEGVGFGRDEVVDGDVWGVGGIYYLLFIIKRYIAYCDMRYIF